MTLAADDLATFLHGWHSCALAAYVLVGLETGRWPPDRELTRQRAYDLFNHGWLVEDAGASLDRPSPDDLPQNATSVPAGSRSDCP